MKKLKQAIVAFILGGVLSLNAQQKISVNVNDTGEQFDHYWSKW